MEKEDQRTRKKGPPTGLGKADGKGIGYQCVNFIREDYKGRMARTYS